MSLELTAKDILETGDIPAFEEFLIEHSDKINIQFLFEGRLSFLVILVQTFRKTESLFMDRTEKIMIDDYKRCLQFLVELGCNLDNQDSMGRTLAHWTILLHCLELLAVALALGCDPLLQDIEGETIVHLAIQYNDQMALETIKLYANNQDVFESPSETSGATPLIYAVQMGVVDILQKLLQLNVNIDAQESNKYKRTALHYALHTNNEEIFTILLKHKARSDITDYEDKSVIDRVAEHPKDNFLRIITHYSSSEIFSGGNGGGDSSGYSSIIVACKNGDCNMLCSLIESEKSRLTDEDGEGRTALHHCVDNADTRCAERLLEASHDLIDRRDKNGFTVLHLATIANNVKLVQFLIRSGCDTSATDSDGHTCLDWAVVCCAVDLIDIFHKTNPDLITIIDSYGASPLHYATQSFLSPEGSVQGPIVLEKLLKNEKVDINCVDYDNRTPLLWAASLGIMDCCQILLESGADINHRDSNGLSVLHCAASRGHYDVIDLVVNTWSMSVDVEDNNLCTPLFYAVTLKHMSIIHFLVEKRSNPNHQDIKGRSVSHCAALKGYCDVLDLIKKVGGSLTLKNNNGDLPLHEAAETGKFEVCQLLLEKLEESNELHLINEFNKSGLTPLHKASRNNHYKICKLLIERGADVNLLTKSDPNFENDVDKCKFSPVDLASDSSVISLLKDYNGLTAKEYHNKMGTANFEDKTLSNSLNNTNENQDNLTIKENVNITEWEEYESVKPYSSRPLLSARKETELPSATPPNADKQSKKNDQSSSKKQKSVNNIRNQKSEKDKGSSELPTRSISGGKKKNSEKKVKSFKKLGVSENSEEILKNIKDDSVLPINKQKPTHNNHHHKTSNRNELNHDYPETSVSEKPNKSKNVIKNKDNDEQKEVLSIQDKRDTDQSKETEDKNSHRENEQTKESENQNYNEKKGKRKLMSGRSHISERQENVDNLERSKVRTNRPSNSNTMERKGKSKTKSAKQRSTFEVIENGLEIKSLSYTNLTRDSNATTSSSISSHTSNHRKNNRSKSSNLSSKVIESVREYESVRDRMRQISDQRRVEMFQGYNKAMKLAKISSKKITRSDDQNRNPKTNSIELPELTFFHPVALQKSQVAKKHVTNPTPQTKTEQIKSAYDCGHSLDSLSLY